MVAQTFVAIGARLEFMLVPLAFGIGSGLTMIVGVAAGANDWRRAVRAAWIGSLVAGLGIGAFGWIVALVPEGWARLFTNDPEVVAATISSSPGWRRSTACSGSA